MGASLYLACEYLPLLRAVNGSDTAPFVKAAIRDVKSYRDSKNYRNIPVGYSAGKSFTMRSDHATIPVHEWTLKSSNH